jgi:late competence protein required for DNA uptake (superfamily II DNA/RNA helicase)
LGQTQVGVARGGRKKHCSKRALNPRLEVKISKRKMTYVFIFIYFPEMQLSEKEFDVLNVGYRRVKICQYVCHAALARVGILRPCAAWQ